MSNQNLRRLEAAGVNLDAVSEGQRQVFASLSDDELAVITAVKQRLSTADADVEAHGRDNGAIIY